MWEDATAGLEAEGINIEEVFGTKQEWAVSIDVGDLELDVHHIGEPLEHPTQPNGDAEVVVNKLVVVQSIEHHVRQGVDHKQEQAEAFLNEVKTKGTPTPSDGIWRLPTCYFRKIIGGRPVGRL